MTDLIRAILHGLVCALMLLFWLAGLVLAKGAWSTAFAVFPPYAWYLCVEYAMRALGIVS